MSFDGMTAERLEKFIGLADGTGRANYEATGNLLFPDATEEHKGAYIRRWRAEVNNTLGRQIICVDSNKRIGAARRSIFIEGGFICLAQAMQIDTVAGETRHRLLAALRQKDVTSVESLWRQRFAMLADIQDEYRGDPVISPMISALIAALESSLNTKTPIV